ncbi:MAG TPA: thioredoxin family protein [Galbitalea sp.]|jgi:hypothetical protein|nr:thioredoxin family protein [Galbitalea sp.]
MGFEILHIGDCPNWEQAGELLREALTSTGHVNESIGFRLLQTSDDAVGTVFAGSPTITLDGVDLFPTRGATSELACRVYLTPSGLAGVPTVDQLIEGIRANER